MKKSERNGARKQRSVDQITRQNVEAVTRLEEATKSKATIGDRISEKITQFCGSMWFAYLHVAWFGLWILLNAGFPRRFDLMHIRSRFSP